MSPDMSSLAGQLLVAMPQMQDHRFQRSVIYLCAHNEEGAMGLVAEWAGQGFDSVNGVGAEKCCCRRNVPICDPRRG